jgi:hypothetical protein
MSVSVECVDPRHVRDIWPSVKHLIKRAMLRTGLDHSDDVEAAVLSGEALLWVLYNGVDIEAAIVTRVSLTDHDRVCTFVACGGTGLSRHKGALKVIERYALAQRCNVIRIIGRHGWERALPEYKAAHVILERRM